MNALFRSIELAIELERPIFLILALAAIPAGILALKRISLAFRFYAASCPAKAFPLKLRTASFCTAWAFLCLAAAGISWGSRRVPVQKSGAAVCMILDISHSMNAADGTPDGSSRMKAAASYAGQLLSRLEGQNSGGTAGGTAVSVVLVKGGGVLAIPATYDYASIYTLLDALSSDCMSAKGTSLGQGVRTAIGSFPSEGAFSCSIWLLTDGEETDSALEPALLESVRSGIPVTIIGFGSESETGVLAGDGKTLVKSALRAEKMMSVAGSVSYGDYDVAFVRAAERGSGAKVLSRLGGRDAVAYETRPVDRRSLFSALALLCFAAGMALSSASGLRARGAASAAAMLFLLCGCGGFSENTSGCGTVIRGVFAFHAKDLPLATACFLETEGWYPEMAGYNLGSVYLAQGQENSAIARLSTAQDHPSDSIRAAAQYNLGVAQFHLGNFGSAASHFAEALRCNPDLLDAKVNLELALSRSLSGAKPAAQEELPASEEQGGSALKPEIFSLLRDAESARWQAGAGSADESDGEDY